MDFLVPVQFHLNRDLQDMQKSKWNKFIQGKKKFKKIPFNF